MFGIFLSVGKRQLTHYQWSKDNVVFLIYANMFDTLTFTTITTKNIKYKKMVPVQVLIGQGKVSKVYLIEGAAYKYFPTSYPLSWIKYEVTIQNEIVSKTKLPILSYDYVNNSREIKMPYIKGVNLTYRIRVEKYKTGQIGRASCRERV